MVPERAVLLRVEHLEHRARRVAAPVGSHLVDLVDQQERVARLGVAERPEDRARHRADVGAPVAADLGLVAHAADRQPYELPSERARDRLAERRLADARRPDEAQDLTRDLVAKLGDREVLEDPLLDLVEIEVVPVEHLARVREVEVVLGSVFQGSVRIHSRYVRITPYSAAACGSRSSRCSSRPAAFSTSSGSVPSASSRSRSSATSACSGSASPSSAWIAFSCCRRKYSRWPFSISDCICDWIFEPSSKTSSSRLRIVTPCAGAPRRRPPRGSAAAPRSGSCGASRRRDGRARSGRRRWRRRAAAPPAGTARAR